LGGCGGVAEAHLNAATKFNLPIEVTALVDTNPARIPIVAALADGPCTPYDTIEDALAQAADEIDVIAIFLPHNIHESSTIQMLQTGKHVFLEKPMAPSVEVRTDSALHTH
jgi:predicted dehydrogenase